MRLVKLQNLQKNYGSGESQFQVLKNVNLEILQGEFIALMGPSGSGKSTFSNILGCLDVADGGIYEFCGIDVCKLNLNERARLRRSYFGFVFQGFNLLSKTTALENVELPLMYKGYSSKERKEIAKKALQRVGLEDRLYHTNTELSGGQQQRVAIARALAIAPKFLIADEPTGNLDSQRSFEIMEFLQKINDEEKITILMVTHESEMASFASREIYFRDGRIEGEIRR